MLGSASCEVDVAQVGIRILSRERLPERRARRVAAVENGAPSELASRPGDWFLDA